MRTTGLFLMLFAITLASCNNNDQNKNDPQATVADSLYHHVMAGHDVGMAKMGRLTRAEQTTRRLLDSIQKLPARARQLSEPLRVKLDSLQKDLSYAEFAMNKWMDDFKFDSAVNDPPLRIKYLESENIKVSKVKNAILDGLEKADSLIKDRF
jgi:hypothetical protein